MAVRSVLPHRRFVSVELPFCLPVTPSQPREADRQLIEAFVPPSFLSPCLGEVATAAPGIVKTDKKTAEKREEGEEGQGPSTPDVPFTIASSTEYSCAEVFSGWRPLDFDANLGDPQNTCAGARRGAMSLTQGGDEESTRERERMLRESFPSFLPQVLLQGFYRNDLLIEVSQTRRLKRRRNAETGDVLEEKFIPNDESVPPATARVIGVVSREVGISRPADFCFTPYSTEQVEKVPHVCGPNVFPPAHFVAEKTPFEVECEFAYDSSVPGARPRHDGSDAAHASNESPNDPVEWEFEVMPTLSVVANDPHIPPPMLEGQKKLLDRLNQGNEDCVEVQVVKKLLEERPIWIPRDLLDAILQSGVCPRTHINKKIMVCLTYVIRNGPFNRLRIRNGFDPYASYTTAPLQRIPVKIARRSELGTLLRDISRVPHIADVMREVAAKRSAEMPSALEKETVKVTKEEGKTKKTSNLLWKPRGTLFEKLAAVIQAGRLYIALQIIDLSNDKYFNDLLSKVEPAGPMPIERRSEPYGWIAGGSYHLASTYIMDALAEVIRTDVVPALEKRQGGNTHSLETSETGESVQLSPSLSSSSSTATDEDVDGERRKEHHHHHHDEEDDDDDDESGGSGSALLSESE